MFGNFDVNKFRNKIEKSGNSGSVDNRFLNYYNLDFNETVTIRLLPYENELFLEYETHGPNLRNPAIGSIACSYKSSGERCPICSHSYNFYSAGDKDEAKRWRGKTTTVAQCIVIDSGNLDVNVSDDKNPIKLIYLPWGMKEAILDPIIDGRVDNPSEVDFVIKKTKNQGGLASYSKSYYNIGGSSDFPEDILEMIENGQAYLYDLNEELPKPSTAKECQEWLDNAIEIDSGKVANTSVPQYTPSAVSTTESVTEAPAPTEPATPKRSAADLLAKLNRNR